MQRSFFHFRTTISINILDTDNIYLVQSDFFVHVISGSQGCQVSLDLILKSKCNDVDSF